MKKYRNALLTLLLSLFCPLAIADSVNNATILNISTTNGYVLILFSPAMTGGPTCATQTQWLVYNATTAGGAVLDKKVMIFYTLGKTVYLSGSGQCDIYGNTETLLTIENSD